MPNDTTTTLNSGSGGDKMDESLVTQSDQVTQAKRPRVVIGGDSGGSDLVQPVSADPGKNPVALPTLAHGVVSETPETFQDGELRRLSLTSEGRLRVAATQAVMRMELFGDTSPIATDPNEAFHPFAEEDPYGI